MASKTTSFTAHVTVSRVVRTEAETPSGFGTANAPKVTKEIVEDLNVGIRASSANEVALKIGQALSLLDGANVSVVPGA
jgi:hypothetical protein